MLLNQSITYYIFIEYFNNYKIVNLFFKIITIKKKKKKIKIKEYKYIVFISFILNDKIKKYLIFVL